MPDCARLGQYDMYGGNGKYYNMTPQYFQCINETRNHSEQCDQYLGRCFPPDNYECGTTVIDGENFRETPASNACRDAVGRERDACGRFIERVNSSSIIMWHDNRGSESAATRTCDLRFTLPSDNKTAEIQPVVAETRLLPQSPVESLYCNILQLFGRTC